MIVLVPGVPETDGLWRKLQHLLGADPVALSMPGVASECSSQDPAPA
jgi:hypothetical protein